MIIKILFIPNPMPSHIVPLIALAKQLDTSAFDTVFLLPKEFHEYVRKFNFKVLDIDRRPEERTTPEMIAFSKFKPHVVVDDLSYTTAFSTRFTDMPRISVVRKGIIPGETYTPGYKHSSTAVQFLESINKMNLPGHGMWKPESVADLFTGNINIIPSIPSIEELPDKLKHNDTYIYAGPLVLSDKEIMENLASLGQLRNGKKYSDNRIQVRDFINNNQHRKIVYFTHGLTDPADITNRAHFIIKWLLDKGVAIITNVQDYSSLIIEEQSRFFSSPVLPMHSICSKAILMVHHCGSGTYNYQLLNEVPAIILGSKCYDRDDVALQLAKKDSAVFISAELSEETWQANFEKAAAALLNPESTLYRAQKTSLAKLNKEITQTSAGFNFGNIILKLLKGK